jgi:hypothetical protein
MERAKLSRSSGRLNRVGIGRHLAPGPAALAAGHGLAGRATGRGPGRHDDIGR